ncbi:hypothetical protein K0504_11575 [Neiella marina]|uniref:DUF560 domain-containing protein n=1 Tax=Neiella holothuriorum TaxID=2870530 RepID=A0ABS7EHI1_9GAMM|nr:hypothetical protein [Neiella holothuriorum]MBW8191675.1 hypothetical protein [Neiella holothuriorum]
MLLMWLTTTTLNLATPSLPPVPAEQEADMWRYAQQHMQPCSSSAKENYPWYDKAHLLLSDTVCEQALWFDSFFGPDQVSSSDVQSASSLVQLNLDYVYRERESDQLKPRVQASINLPNTSNKLKLLIEGRDESVTGDNLTSPAGRSQEKSAAAVRYIFFDQNNWDLNFDVGAHFNGGPFTRIRARNYKPLSERTIFKFTQDLTLELEDSWYETTRFTIDNFHDDVVYRYQAQSKYGEKTDGIEWRLLVARIKQLTSRSAIAGFASVSGATEDPSDDDESEIYRLGLNYRKSIWRPWFVVHVEPQITFPRKYDYQTNYLFLLGIEVQFGKGRRSPSYRRVNFATPDPTENHVPQ